MDNAPTGQALLAVEVMPATPSGMPLLSPGLSPLLTDPRANDDGAAVRTISRSAPLLREVEALLPVLAEASEPATKAGLMAILAEEGIAYGLNERPLSQETWNAFWGPYLRALEGISGPCLRAAFVAWNRNHIKPNGEEAVRFYPRPPQIFALAHEERAKVGMMRHRARKALEHRAPALAPPRERLSKAEMIEKGWMNEDGSVNLGPAIPKTTAQAVSGITRERTFQAIRDGVAAVHAHLNAAPAPLTDGEEAV